MANEYQLINQIRRLLDLPFEQRALRAYHLEYIPMAVRKFRYDIDKNNNMYAKFMLARIYYVGAGHIAKDINTSTELAQAAAENNVVDAMHFLLDIYCCGNDPEYLRHGKYIVTNRRSEYINLRLKLLLQASGEYGAVDSKAMNELWAIVHTDEKEYSKWKTTLQYILHSYSEDTVTGTISDTVKLGQIYLRSAVWSLKNSEEGNVVDDDSVASLYLEQAGEYGQVAAYCIIGHEIYRKGLGINSRDLDTAFNYVKRAADAGHEFALRKLCHFPEYRFKLSTEDRVNYLLRHAAQAYNIKSLYELGVELCRGIKMTRDYELGLACFKLAAITSVIIPKDAKIIDRQYEISLYNTHDIIWLTLGLCYKFGITKEIDYNRAITCYYLGLFSTLYSGNLIYQSTLGCLCEIGKIFENRNAKMHDYVKALHCYKLIIRISNSIRIKNKNFDDSNYGTYWAYANYRLLKLSRKLKDNLEIPDLEICRKAVQMATDKKGLLSGYHKGVICEYGFIRKPDIYLASKYYALATSKLMKNPNLDDNAYASGFPAIHDDVLRKKAHIRRGLLKSFGKIIA